MRKPEPPIVYPPIAVAIMRNSRWLAVLGIGTLMVAAGVVVWFKISHDPNVIWLSPTGGAQWIRHDRPVRLRARFGGGVVFFQKQFDVSEECNDLALVVHALKVATVKLDGELLYSNPSALKLNVVERAGELFFETQPSSETLNWKPPVRIAVPFLSAGRHELIIAVVNPSGPPAMLAYAKPLDLATGRDWLAKAPGHKWRPALPVTTRRLPQISEAVSSQFGIPAAYIGALAAIFFLTFILAASIPSTRLAAFSSKFDMAGSLRWMLIAAWLVLAACNFSSLSLDYGFDSRQHVQYVKFLSERHRIPLATDGLQMFQSPLSHILAAAVHKMASLFVEDETAWRTVLVMSFLTGVAQVEIAFRALKAVFPERQDLRLLGLLVAGLMPMSLYMSQVIGNEPLAAVFAAGAVTLAIISLQSPKLICSQPAQYALGTLWGLALLTKISTVLLLLPIGIAIGFSVLRVGNSLRTLSSCFARVFGTAILISGWYYGRNWILLGKPFIGGWDPERGFVWWQDPGYRTFGQFTSFGQALWHPIYSAYASFWDSVYSTMWADGMLSGRFTIDTMPPWNYSFMLVGTWLALLPTAAILLGAVVAFLPSRRARQPALIFAVSCVATYLAAMLYLYLHVPIYSAGKASYTLALLPCYGVLAAAGFDLMLRNRILRAVVFGWMACWAIFAYCAYMIV
jgi:hypothetical protein